ncbi:MAG TPA: glucose-6-phosphate dehydrogenase [Candidatus Dormibacteraeota bacterium]|nr:glucose-6-phosphate dehydrogenase [Candidatus Dormibacteraeota bacterium]
MTGSANASLLAPSILVIFGITGDLSKRKLLPSLYHLFKDGLLPKQISIVGTSRQAITVNDFLTQIELCILETDNICDPAVLKLIRQKLTIIKFDPADSHQYDELLDRLNDIEEEQGVCMNRLYYLSIPPNIYSPLVRNLGLHGLNKSCKHGQATTRLLVEKPFGYDLESAQDLIDKTSQYFNENQIFRIDHYLAKETVQNILAFRKHNPLFTSLWNRHHIKMISIKAYEKIGIEGRVAFYEQVGALRDIVQSHLLQLLALTTMELPEDITDASAIHAKKLALLRAVQPLTPDQVKKQVFRAQYVNYRKEVSNPSSQTETFVGLNLRINNERWKGVPIHIATGKALAEKQTIIQLIISDESRYSSTNELTFQLQPNEGISLALRVKTPSFAHALETARMDFSYQNTFGNRHHPDAYERVIVDVLRGDHILFTTSEEVLASWTIIEPILDEWARNKHHLPLYPMGATESQLLMT